MLKTTDNKPIKISESRLLLWILGIKGLLLVIFFIFLAIAIVGILGGMFFLGVKNTNEYQCAVSELKKNKEAVNLLGEPIEMGFWAYGNFSFKNSQRAVNFQTTITGPKGSGTLYVNSFRNPVGSNFKMSLEKDGKEIRLYNGIYPCE